VSRSRMALRLVLDTNVWLDWLVFDDARMMPLRAVVEAEEAEVFMSAACEEELVRVLASPLRKTFLDTDVQARCMEECRRIVKWTDGSASRDATRLPVCRDPDDQKFLQLADGCRADFLVTRDRALLVLGRRRVRPLSFRIVMPEALVEVVGAGSGAASSVS
jgi:putative PIN family toxin of toxin-antitoxin system